MFKNILKKLIGRRKPSQRQIELENKITPVIEKAIQNGNYFEYFILDGENTLKEFKEFALLHDMEIKTMNEIKENDEMAEYAVLFFRKRRS